MRRKTVEEYIETIHALELTEGRAATGRIARDMGVKPSSATEMLQKLQKEGLLQYESYAGATLTDAGRRLAVELMGKHRAIADFLEIIGVRRSVAERDACQMEHHVGRETMEQLEKFVQFAGLSSRDSIWIESFRRFCQTEDVGRSQLGDCGDDCPDDQLDDTPDYCSPGANISVKPESASHRRRR